jgi:hypothetical protein
MRRSTDVFLDEAQRAIDRYIASRPQCVIEAAQPSYRGGTNRIFFGSVEKRPAVFKYFTSDARWRNELRCLRHFRSTALVPEILDAQSPRLIVTNRLPGHDLCSARIDPAEVPRLSRAIGQSIANLSASGLPPGIDGEAFDIIPWAPSPRAAMERYLFACERIHRTIPRYGGSLFAESLRSIREILDRLPPRHECLWHEDISNAKLDRGRFVGFFDLEMCRPGTRAMQLGVALHLCTVSPLRWRDLLDGYAETCAPPDAEQTLAMNHFYHWIRICRWGRWDGDPSDHQSVRDSLTDADWFEEKMTAACRIVEKSA